jgi:hypothetical protein
VALATILVDKAGSQDEFTRITALKWIKVRHTTLLLHTWLQLRGVHATKVPQRLPPPSWPVGCKQHTECPMRNTCHAPAALPLPVNTRHPPAAALLSLPLNTRVQEFVTQASGQLVCLYADLIGAVLPNISHPNRDIQAVAKEANNALLNLQPSAELPAKVCVPVCLFCVSTPLLGAANDSWTSFSCLESL